MEWIIVSGEEAFWKKLVGGWVGGWVVTEVDGRLAVVDERVELARAGLG